MKSEKICSGCKVKKKSDQFTSHSYITKQGFSSIRLDSRCRECRKVAASERRKNPEIRKREADACRLRRKKDPVAVKIYAKAYRSSETGRRTKAKLQRMRKARLKAASEFLTENEKLEINNIYTLAVLQETKLRQCVNCDDDLELQVHVDHKVPIALGGRHHPLNLQILSGRANLEKGISLCHAQ